LARSADIPVRSNGLCGKRALQISPCCRLAALARRRSGSEVAAHKNVRAPQKGKTFLASVARIRLKAPEKNFHSHY